MKIPNGYIMVDCTGLDLIKGSTPQTINGLYQKCIAACNTGKPIYCVNAVWDDKGVVTPIEVLIVQFDGYVIATASTLQIIVTSSDVVTIENMVG